MVVGIIPARYASTRFPGKPLALIGNRTMIECTYRQVAKSKVDRVVVATDHPAIAEEVKRFGGEVVMTSPHHPSGTDRCCEALSLLDEPFDFVINVQGDEPFIRPEQINQLIHLLTQETQIATLVTPIREVEELKNPHVVKVVMNCFQEALYFSRSPIPHLRGVPIEEWLSYYAYWKHLGIYAYRSDVLNKITRWETSCLEKVEALEQLRWLENGVRIKIDITPYTSIGIDTPEDLLRVKQLYSSEDQISY
ncbi:MAG: 3-deoxy-manno-octulosonate cytidylyltransferase [Cytophagales bacterium]|nr:3-deoxy-manno-octulosonate cytidylyltransferase [Cytophagales bacterium]MDW8384287.1 3-deoxy-manno-octulosonate cytidylyltransferase [Flammeovirgaceae bacterium]